MVILAAYIECHQACLNKSGNYILLYQVLVLSQAGFLRLLNGCCIRLSFTSLMLLITKN